MQISFEDTNNYSSKLWPTTHKMLLNTALVLIGVVFLALSAQLVIPFVPVPLTFQSAAVILIAMLYGSRLGGLTVLAYLMGGGLSLPLFASFTGGMAIFASPTAGYLFGFVPAALLAGKLAETGNAQTFLRAFVSCLVSSSVIFFFGILVLSNQIGFQQACYVGLFPFLVTEPAKLLAIALFIPKIWKKA